jgi:hypothetical protein
LAIFTKKYEKVCHKSQLNKSGNSHKINLPKLVEIFKFIQEERNEKEKAVRKSTQSRSFGGDDRDNAAAGLYADCQGSGTD